MHLLLIAADQLSFNLAALRDLDPAEVEIVMAELAEEAGYAPHHKKKVAFLFSAMRHFCKALRERGYRVHYFSYGEHDCPDFESVLKSVLRSGDYSDVLLTEFGEWRLRARSQEWQAELSVPVKIFPDNRFLCTHQQFQKWAKGRKSLRMEYFYREMRRSTGLLMTADGDPEGGQWNFDAENRSGFDPELTQRLPPSPAEHPDEITESVLELVADAFSEHPGTLEGFGWAVTHEGARRAWKQFLQQGLTDYGRYQDAMGQDHPFMFHAVCGLYINCGLLDPRELCEEVEAAWRRDEVPINAAEGFIRQIIGWREYIRGIYWLTMPDYAERNYFSADRPLPDWYWTGDTRMNCMSQAIGQTLEHAYAHHIQRLMLTGNFALLAGLDVKEVCAWYLGVYADAYEWVELPNTLGMALFADGGLLASKPYAASGKYIHRMSNYCRHCEYKVTDTTGEQACPFNALYWTFLDRERERLQGNPRMGMMYRNLDKWSAEKRQAVMDKGRAILDDLNGL